MDDQPEESQTDRRRAPRRPRRTVLMTAGLTASATVMALNISLASSASANEDTPPGSLYGDATILDPDADSGPAADAP